MPVDKKPTGKASTLAERMKPKPVQDKPERTPKATLDGSFHSVPEEYPKRLTLDLTVAQHKKIKIFAMVNDTSMNKIFRDFIDSLE